MNKQTKLIIKCFIITVYVLISTWIGFFLATTIFEIPYKAEYQLLTNWVGVACSVCELVVYIPILLLIGIWIHQTFWKESNIHPGMSIVVYSVILISVMFFVTRAIIIYNAFFKTVIPVTVIVLANYFHDAAFFQLPMTPVLMTLERLIATKQVKTYELSQSTEIVTCLVLVSWTYAIWIHFISVYSEGSDVYFTTVYVQYVLQILTIVLMVYIYFQNYKRYQKIMIKTLTERYQTAENIRLLRATFKFTIITIFWNFLLTGFSFVMKIDDLAIRKVSSRFWDTSVAIGILLMLLIYFKAVGILQKVHSMACKNSKASSKSVIIRSVTGYVVPTTAEADDYFSQLKKSWQ